MKILDGVMIMKKTIFFPILILISAWHCVAQDYLSAALMVPVKKPGQLMAAYDGFANSFEHIQADSIEPQRYHMTLIGLRIDVNDQINSEQKRNVRKSVRQLLEKCIEDQLQKFSSSLPFEKVTNFRNKIVATFRLTKQYKKLISTIEDSVMQDPFIKKCVEQGIITDIKRLHANPIPHVSLATINNSTTQRCVYVPCIKIEPFTIQAHKSWVTAYWKQPAPEGVNILANPYKIAAAVLAGAGMLMYLIKKYW